MFQKRCRVCCLLALLLASPSTATAAAGNSGNILLVLSGEHNIFENIRRGVLETAANKVTTLFLKQCQDSPEKVFNTHRVGIIAVGAQACRLAAMHAPPETPLVLCTYACPPPARSGRQGHCLVLDAVRGLKAQLRIVRATLPWVKHIGVLHLNDTADADYRGIHEGISVRNFRIPSWKYLSRTVDAALKWSDIIWLPPDPGIMTTSTIQLLLRKSLLARKPVFTFSPRLIRGGALAGLVPDPRSMGVRAVSWLEGTPPPDKNEDVLWINRKVADYLGISFSSENITTTIRELR